jgi:hypothetical protein
LIFLGFIYFLAYGFILIIAKYIKSIEDNMENNSIKFCPECRNNDILNELLKLENNLGYFCDECGKIFNEEYIEIGIGIKIDPNKIETIIYTEKE